MTFAVPVSGYFHGEDETLHKPISITTPYRSERLSTINADAAGIDVGSQWHVVAVPPQRDPDPVRTFQSFTGDLQRLADWLVACEVKTVAMESTGVYWIPLFEVLEARGLHVCVVNARDVKHVPGRKTDVNDAQWLQRLHTYGLLRASFHPAADIAALRVYLRQRERLLDYAAAHIQHMQKALTQMNLQLHPVVTDITGVTGMRIIRAILAGVRDPAVLASYRDVRCKASVETIERALQRGTIKPSICSRWGKSSRCMTPIRRTSRRATGKSRPFSLACGSIQRQTANPPLRDTELGKPMNPPLTFVQRSLPLWALISQKSTALDRIWP